MALIKSGPVGRFNGKIGNVVVAPWKGLLVGREAPTPTNKPATLTQLEQRAKFGLVTGFLSKIGETVRVGYQNSGGNMTAYNVAARYHLDNAVTGVYPAYALDYSKVQLNDGVGKVLDAPTGIAHTPVVNNRTTITWEAIELVRQDSLPTDQIRIVLFNATADFFLIHPAAAQRSVMTATVRLPIEEEDDVVHAWVMFVSADGKRTSRSRYLGIITA
jgi:hypothetical protein